MDFRNGKMFFFNTFDSQTKTNHYIFSSFIITLKEHKMVRI